MFLRICRPEEVEGEQPKHDYVKLSKDFASKIPDVSVVPLWVSIPHEMHANCHLLLSRTS